MLPRGCVLAILSQPQASSLRPDTGCLFAWEAATSCNKTLLLSTNALAAWAEQAPKAREG